MYLIRTKHLRAAIPFATAILLTAFAATAHAQLPPLGGEVLIHPPTSTTSEYEASVAMDAVGNYAIAYTNHDGTNAGIAVQRFHRNGTPNGPLIIPITDPAPVQQDASIAMANDGRFVVVWEDNGARAGNNFDVHYALYNADGSLVTRNIVNTTLAGVRENARVAMHRNTGEFVVVFAGGSSQGSVDVYYRRFSAMGLPLDANEIRINTGATAMTALPSVAFSTSGNFIVGWEADSNGDNNWEATFQRYSFGTTAATPLGSNTIASAAGHDTTNVEVASDMNGNFVLAWVDGLPAHSNDPKDLLYRIYSPTGTPAGPPQVLKTGAFSGNGDTDIPRIRLAMDDDGDFVAIYLHNDEIYARFVSATGTLLGSEIHVNTTTNPNPGEFQTKPWIAINPAGNRATAVWNGTGTTDSTGVHKQRYAAPNVAPILAAIGNLEVTELEELTFTASATEGPDNFGDTVTYSLANTPPAGASINSATGAFSWTPTEEQGPGIYNVTFRATDDGEPPMFSEQTITITVAEDNQAPTDITLSQDTIVNNSPAGTTVATITGQDPDLPAQVLTFTLVDGAGDTHNSMFNISGDLLQVSTPPNINDENSLSIRIRVTDDMGGTFEKEFTINVVPPTSVEAWHLY